VESAAPAQEPVALVSTPAEARPRDDLGALKPSADGSFRLRAGDAELHGASLRVEARDGANELAGWSLPSDYARWALDVVDPGLFDLELVLARDIPEGARIALESAFLRTVLELRAGPRDALVEFFNLMPLPEPGAWYLYVRIAEPSVALREIVVRPYGRLAP
jgi:hypothetical protein